MNTEHFPARPRPWHPLALLASFALVFCSPGLAVDRAQVRDLKQRYGRNLETGARQLLADPAAGSLPLTDLVEVYAALASGSQLVELQKLAGDTLREALTSPALEKQRSIEEGIALWQVLRQGSYPREWRPLAARCVHRLARTLDDAALRDAFLAASPAKAPLDPTGSARTKRQVLFWLWSDRWIERELSVLARAPQPEFRCPPFAGAVPAELESEVTADGVAAWMEAARVRAWSGGGAKAAPKPPDAPAPKRQRSDVGEPNFEALLDRFAIDPPSVSRDELGRYYWTSGFWCGTGGESFRAVQRRVALMIELRERRVPQFLAGALAEAPPYDEVPPSWDDPRWWRMTLLELCGLDWEKLLSSTLLLDRPVHDPGRGHYAYATEVLAARGSTFAAKILAAVERRALARRERTGVRDRVLRADLIVPFITPSDTAAGARVEVAPDVQKELIELLLADLRSKTDYIQLANSLPLLAPLHRPEIKEAIRPLLASRFDYVVYHAGAALTAMGEEQPQFRYRPSPGFRILLNGEPWPFDRKTFTALHYETRQDGWGINNSLSPDSRDPQRLEFHRDRVVQVADSMLAARLSIRPRAGKARPDERASLTHPWFSVPVKLPIAFDDTNEVRVTTYPFAVAVSYPRSLAAERGSTVELELTWLDEPGAKHPRPSLFQEPVREDYTFAALQPGRYRLAITAPGAARYESGPIEVKKGMARFAVQLAGASDIQAKIVLPDFADDDQIPHAMRQALHPELWLGFIPLATLYRDGAEVASSTFDTKTSRVTFPGIVPGKYRLRVHGMSDFVEKASVPLASERAVSDPEARRRLRTMVLGNRTESGEPASAAWEDAEIEVRVESSSPVVIDAGEIRLQRIALPKR